MELENVPTEGFVLNKDAGGVRSSWGWNDRLEKCRVFDPRGFEFEISIPNLLFILQECNSSKGKGLEGEFVYSWSGTELVLLPVQSPEFAECKKFSDRQAKKFSLRDLKVGKDYMGKNNKVYTYMGRMQYFQGTSALNFYKKSHVFAVKNECSWKKGEYDFVSSAKIAEEIGDCTNLPEIVEELKKSKHGGEITGVSLSAIDLSDVGSWGGQKFITKEEDVYHVYWCRQSYGYYRGAKAPYSVGYQLSFEIKGGAWVRLKEAEPLINPNAKDLKKFEFQTK